MAALVVMARNIELLLLARKKHVDLAFAEKVARIKGQPEEDALQLPLRQRRRARRHREGPSHPNLSGALARQIAEASARKAHP